MKGEWFYMNQQKMPPALLRLIVIFPNVLSYLLLFGLIIFVNSNYDTLKATDNLTVWLIFIVVLAPAAAYTTFSIVKKIRAGQM
jgi:hypothetical protein